MVEVPDSVMRLLLLDRSDGHRERKQKGRAVDRLFKTPGFSGYVSLLALVIVGASGSHLGSVLEQNTMDRFLKQTGFGVVRDQYTLHESSDSAVATEVSPDVAILIEQHRAALAGLTMPVPVPAVICH